MKSRWNIPHSSLNRLVQTTKGKLLWIGGAGASVTLVLLSCGTSSRTLMAPPSIPGATFVGTKECATCHEKLVRDFRTADHSRLQAKGENAKDMGCEACHGPGSKHVAAGGGAGTIINPKKSPTTCFQCHLDKKAEFSLPYSHPVLAGKMTCSDCHDSHKGSATRGGGTNLARKNALCADCHSAQTGPFVYEHEATREGCSSCHSPHGSTNPRMLTERNNTLCLKCHFQNQASGFGQTSASTGIRIGSGNHSTGRLSEGTCWTADCHEGVHGSNTDKHLRE
jgi:predicted CXXCH cytochrome family protein